eukprot:UN3874
MKPQTPSRAVLQIPEHPGSTCSQSGCWLPAENLLPRLRDIFATAACQGSSVKWLFQQTRSLAVLRLLGVGALHDGVLAVSARVAPRQSRWTGRLHLSSQDIKLLLNGLSEGRKALDHPPALVRKHRDVDALRTPPEAEAALDKLADVDDVRSISVEQFEQIPGFADVQV